jgi:pyruvate,orthophosphate dikinase
MLGDIPKTEASSSDDFQTLLTWADKHRRLKVRANAETPEDAAKARELGAEGIGLCRTEHMFFDAERIDQMRGMILAEKKEERAGYLAKLLEFQRADMLALFEVMDGLPVTVRLLDPPLHEFLPHDEEDMAALSKRIDVPVEVIRERAHSLEEVNPMLGFRGCRLSIVFPEITEMQVEAIISAAILAKEKGLNPFPEIMIPLVVNVREIRRITEVIEKGILKAMEEKQVSIPYKIGTMMETPRACLGAKRLAPAVEFMSFGTNDLTQMTYGFSRDDIGKFIGEYLDRKIVEQDPFVSLDQRAVGRLMKIAIEDSKIGRKGIKYGICGEHGGDPKSIRFCHEIGLDYVSCSPYRVPVARIAAAQANVLEPVPE